MVSLHTPYTMTLVNKKTIQQIITGKYKKMHAIAGYDFIARSVFPEIVSGLQESSRFFPISLRVEGIYVSERINRLISQVYLYLVKMKKIFATVMSSVLIC